MLKNSVLLFLLLSMPTAGASLEDFVAATPVPNHVYLHAAPAVGDFAIYRSVDGSQLMRIELAAISGTADAPDYRVRLHWPQARGIVSGFFLEHAYHFDVRADGRVFAATLEHIPSGRMLPLTPAAPGDLGYIGRPDIRPVDTGEMLSTPAGDVGVDAILLYDENRGTPAGPARVTSTNFLSSSVPFGLVRQVNVLETEITAIELAQIILEYSAASDLVKSVLDFVLERSRHQRAETGMTLVDFGRGESDESLE